MLSRRVVLLSGVLLLTVIAFTKSMPFELEPNTDEPSESANEGTEKDIDDETPEDNDDEELEPDDVQLIQGHIGDLFQNQKAIIVERTLDEPFKPANEATSEEIDKGAPDDDDEYEPESDDVQLFQGDIVQDASGDDRTRNQGIQTDLAWPNGVVPYSIHKSIGDAASRQMIIRAMETIESVSCIRFNERKRNDRHFIRISNANKGLCYSVLGRSTDEDYWNVGQPLRLDNDCFNNGTILHQLMHALGFQHEHARTDRDDFIVIDYDNVESEKQENFEMTSDPVTHLGTPYDYSSIMHYKWNEYAVDSNKSTIKIRNKADVLSRTLGTSGQLSFTDIIEINGLYNCSINGPLPVPNNVQYREGDNWVSISWTPPRVGKNIIIFGYKIYYTNSTLPIEEWQSVFIRNATAQSWKVEGLLKSATYVFRMSAIDENGPGSLSNPFLCKTTVTLYRTLPDRPSPPERIRFGPGKSFLMVYWKPPQVTNGIIVGYEIYYTDDDALIPLEQWTDVYISDPKQKKFKIEGLLEGTTYSIRMRASNQNGSGRLSETITANTTTSTA